MSPKLGRANKTRKSLSWELPLTKPFRRTALRFRCPCRSKRSSDRRITRTKVGGGNNEAAPSGAGGSSNPTAGVRPGMGGSGSAPSQSAPAGGNMPSDSQTANHSRPPITGETKGVIGISNLTLNDTASDASQGSVVTSEKNNVKLESGTMMLLRVSQ